MLGRAWRETNDVEADRETANGAGKSSLLKTLAGVQPLRGGDITYSQSIRGRLAYCLGSLELYRDYPVTVAENRPLGNGVVGPLLREDDRWTLVEYSKFIPRGGWPGGALRRPAFAMPPGPSLKIGRPECPGP